MRATRRLSGVLVLAMAWAMPAPSQAQGPPTASPDSTSKPAWATEWEAYDAPRRKMVKWNEFDGPFSTIRLGGGFLYEIAAYSQDEQSKQQIPLESEAKLRDARLLFSGRFKTKRPMTWKAGLMYDGPTDSWLMRETGVMINVPEAWGDFFIGRTKEGFSLNKVMNGYFGWTMERQVALDVIPILADGVKWLGCLPRRNLLWNIGVFTDWLSENQSFSTYDWQFAARIAYVKASSETRGIHLGVSTRYGQADDGKLRLKSRPETFPAPYFLDTGSYAASGSRHVGIEAYYRSGPWMFGSEYYLTGVQSSEAGDPLYYGGEVVATWVVTGESRSYTTVGGVFKTVSPEEPLFGGGPGAVEAVLRVSHLNLDDGSKPGGKFWRITPMINWYLTDNVRLEFAYGYGVLDRFGLEGGTQFFQSRIQFML